MVRPCRIGKGVKMSHFVSPLMWVIGPRTTTTTGTLRPSKGTAENLTPDVTTTTHLRPDITNADDQSLTPTVQSTNNLRPDGDTIELRPTIQSVVED